MEIFAKGQLSYMILNCLLERDFYGLDFITEINKKSNGRINLKKPSVYSSLTRMEKQGYLSSYTKSSDFGPNRRYYSITEKGRNFYQQLKTDFQNNGIDVFRDFKEEYDNSQNITTENSQISLDLTQNNDNESNDFFDFSSLNSYENKDEEQNSNFVSSQADQSKLVNQVQNVDSSENENFKLQENLNNSSSDNKTNIASSNENQNFYANNDKQENFVKEVEVVKENSDNTKDDGAFLNREQVDSYNQRLYDISKDIRKYKKQRSFAEDQIAMTVETPLQESEEKTKANLEAFKASLMENKRKFSNEDEFAKYSERQQRSTIDNKHFQVGGNTYFKEKPVAEVVEDDGKFITNRISNEDLVKPKKIQPPKLKILQSEKNETLPPPKRDVKIDPSHKEIISQLYSRTKDNKNEGSVNALYDYQDLKEFYQEQEISFKEYEKTNLEINHNTNKLGFIHSVITFFLLAIVSAVTFISLYYSNLLNEQFNFMYILLPALQLIIVGIKFYNYKYHTSWIPKKMISFWEILLYTLLIIGAVIGLNFIFGLSGANFGLYATSLILPMVLIIVEMPISYLIYKQLIVKYWK